MTKTILVVDDFASVRLYHMSFLTRKGYRCLGASDGADALVKLGQNQVDLVLLDMVMPGMHGDAFIAQVDANPALAGVPVLMITSEETLARAVVNSRSRVVRLLSKPVVPSLLLQRVQEMLPAAAAPASPGGI